MKTISTLGLAVALLTAPMQAFIDKKLVGGFTGGLITGAALTGAIWASSLEDAPIEQPLQQPTDKPSVDVEGHLGFDKPYKMEIDLDKGMLGNDIHLEDFDNGIDVVIRKRKLRILTTYDLYKNDGSFDAKMYYKPLSYVNPLAYLFTSLQSFKVKGADGSHLGAIYGTFFTFEKALYTIYDRDGKLVAVARVRKNGKEVQINDPKASHTSGIATLKIALNDNWLLHVSRPTKVDHRLLKFLAAIIIDKLAPEYTERKKRVERQAKIQQQAEFKNEHQQEMNQRQEGSHSSDGYGSTNRR